MGQTGTARTRSECLGSTPGPAICRETYFILLHLSLPFQKARGVGGGGGAVVVITANEINMKAKQVNSQST